MTYPSSSGASASNKSLFIQSQISALALEAGLVRHPLVSATDQVLILREIDLTGSATVGEVMDALDGHADPVGAILSLMKAGVIEAELHAGILDENALLTRAGNPSPDDPDPAAPGGTLVPRKPQGPLDAEEGAIAWPEQHDGQTPETIGHHAVMSVSSGKNRGTEDILLAVVDGLKGFPEAITAVFPETVVQTCIVHLLRNSMDFVSWKDRKGLASALKQIYRATDADAAEKALTDFDAGFWGQRYPAIGQSWTPAKTGWMCPAAP